MLKNIQMAIIYCIKNDQETICLIQIPVNWHFIIFLDFFLESLVFSYIKYFISVSTWLQIKFIMASRDSLLDLTKCCLCLCPFHVPRALPCLHSFCESCLENHIFYSRTPAGSFRCPNCRAEYKCPSDGGSHYPLNHLLVSLQSTGTIRDCKKAGESKTGNKSEDPKCLAHIGEKMVKVCLNCNKTMCRYCMTCEHPLRVVGIEQTAKHVKNHYDDLLEELLERKKLVLLRKDELAASEKTCQVGCEKALDAIRRHCANMHAKIKQYQDHLIHQTRFQCNKLADVFLSCRKEGECFGRLLDSCISQLHLILEQPDLWAIASYENMADMIEKVIQKDVPKFEAGWMFQEGPDITIANVGKVSFASILHPAEDDNADLNMKAGWSASSLMASKPGGVALQGNSERKKKLNPTSCDIVTRQDEIKPLSDVNPDPGSLTCKKGTRDNPSCGSGDILTHKQRSTVFPVDPHWAGFGILACEDKTKECYNTKHGTKIQQNNATGYTFDANPTQKGTKAGKVKRKKKCYYANSKSEDTAGEEEIEETVSIANATLGSSSESEPEDLTSDSKYPFDKPSRPKVIYQRTFYCDGMHLEAKGIRDIAVLKSGNLAVITGLRSGQVVISSRTGQVKRILGASGSCVIENASGLSVFHDGNIAVADESKGQILIFKENGELVTSLAHGLRRPKGLAVLANGNIAVCYPHEMCVRIFAKAVFGSSYYSQVTIRTFLCDAGGKPNKYAFRSPRYITAFRGNNIIVSDYAKNTVFALTSKARGRKYRCLWKYRGQVFAEKRDLDCPTGVCTDEHGRVLVVDSGNKRIIVLSSQGKFNKELLRYMTNMPPHLNAVSLQNECLAVGDGFEGSVRMYDYLP